MDSDFHGSNYSIHSLPNIVLAFYYDLSVIFSDSGFEEPQGVYNVTTRKPHALAVIINNDTFSCGYKSRPESAHDVRRLRKVLGSDLGFEVVECPNLTREQMKELFSTKIYGRIKDNHDSFLCCFMSHGNEAGICSEDGLTIRTTTLMKYLDGSTCRELAGKPKILIIHCCRGTGIPEPVYAEVEGLDTKKKKISPHADFICGYSTIDGDYATRGKGGALYIQTLCDVLEKNDCSLNEMLCKVNHKLEIVQKVEVDGEEHEFVQIGQVEHTLREFVYFRPAN